MKSFQLPAGSGSCRAVLGHPPGYAIACQEKERGIGGSRNARITPAGKGDGHPPRPSPAFPFLASSPHRLPRSGRPSSQVNLFELLQL